MHGKVNKWTNIAWNRYFEVCCSTKPLSTKNVSAHQDAYTWTISWATTAALPHGTIVYGFIFPISSSNFACSSSCCADSRSMFAINSLKSLFVAGATVTESGICVRCIGICERMNVCKWVRDDEKKINSERARARERRNQNMRLGFIGELLGRRKTE